MSAATRRQLVVVSGGVNGFEIVSERALTWAEKVLARVWPEKETT